MNKFILLFVTLTLVSLAQAQVPLNDACGSATPIIIPASGNACVNSSLIGATDDGLYDNCEVAGSKEVWFTYTATGSGNTIVVSPASGTPATNLVVSVTSNNCASSVINTCNAAATANGSATATWTYPVGTQVWVFVSSTSGSTGGFQICVTSVTPPATTGKSCATAAPICSKATFSATVAASSNGYQPPCFGASLQQPIIFKFTVGQGGLLNWLATPSCGAPHANATEFDWAVYDITSGCPGTAVACDYNFTGSLFGNPVTTPQGMQGAAGAGCNNTSATGTTGPEVCNGVTVTAGNTYIIILDQYTTGNTCSVSLDFTGSTFTMAPSSIFTVTPDSSCTSINAAFTNSSIAATSQTWSFGDGTTSAAATPPNHSYTVPGTYLVSLTTTSASGCQDSKSHAVQVFPTPTVTATATNSCSAGSNATLTANPSILGGTYLWSPGGATTASVTVTPATSTTYTVTYNLGGCIATATATVTVGGLTVNAGTDSVICANQTITLNGSVTPAVGNYTYSWSPTPANGSTTLHPTISPTGSTLYTLSVTDASGCTATDNVQINVNGVAVPVTATAVPAIICPGQPVQLDCSILPVNCGASPPCNGNNSTSFIGSDSIVQPGTSLQPPTLFGNFLKSGRNQMLYTAAELAPALGGACIIKALTFWIKVFNSNAFLQNFTIKMTCTNLTSLTTWEQNLTTVYTAASYQPQAGTLNGIALTTPFSWDGVSNIIIDICWNNPATFGNQNNKAACTNTAFTSYLYSFSSAADQCGTATAPGTSTLRPNVKFNYCMPNINNYTVTWTPSIGANAVSNAAIHNPTTNPIATTNYNVSIANGGCAGNGVVTVQVDNSTLTAGPDKNSCPNATVALAATVGGTILPGPATFVWTTLAGVNVGNTQNINVNPAVTTTYIVTMNGGSCVKKDTITVNVGSLSPTATPTNATCFGANNGSILAASASGTTPFTFTWSANAATGNLATASNLAPGSYQVTVTDASGCSGSASANITQPTQVTFTSAVINDSCFGGTQGSITITPNGGTGGYTYQWSNSLPSAQTVSNLLANTYTVTVLDANLCSATANIAVAQPSQILFGNAAIQNVRCFNGNTGIITVNSSGGSGAFTYNWSHSGAVHTPTANNLIAGNYTVTAVDGNGCTASATYSITQPATGLTFGASNITNPTCFGYSNGSATVNPSGGVGTLLYLWTPSGQTTQTGNNLSAQAYTVVVKDDSLCTATTTVTPVNPAQIQIVGVVTNVKCFGGSDGAVDITVTNGVPNLVYSWAPGGAVTQDISGVAQANYSVTVTDGNACSAIATFQVTEPSALVLNAPSITDVLCFGNNTGSITVIQTGGTGPFGYSWNPAASNSATNSSLIAGSYSVTVTDANSCTVSAIYTVNQPTAALAFGAPVIVDELCNGASTGSITVSVTGGTAAAAYHYSWSHNANLNSTTASALSAGPYTVTVTDDNGCNLTATNTLSQPTAITFGNPTITNVSCFGGNDGNAQIAPNGGTGSYTYTWNGVAGTNPQNGLVANTYTAVVTDANNCPYGTTVTITEPAKLIVNPIASPALCFGASNGSVDANASGGVSTYTYVWSSGGNTATINGLPLGLYTVTVTDSKGCSASAGGNVTEPSAVIFTTQITQVKCIGDQNGTITPFPSGGTPPYTNSATMDGVTFFFPNSSGVIDGLASGSYVVTVTDNNGCLDTSHVFVPAPLGDTYSLTTDSTSCYGTDYADGALHITGSPLLNGPFQFGVDGGALQYSGDFYNLKAGFHTVLAQNNFGCDTALNALVPEPQDATADVLPGDTTLNLGESIHLSSSFGPYAYSTITSYSWSPSNGLSCTDCPNPIATPYGRQTVYQLTITYNGHCTATASMKILVDGGAPVYIPNTFSPNGDGNNDVFQLYGVGIKTIDLKIFNRWGEKVYESNNQFEGWDGTYKGVLQNPAVFAYEATITYLNDKKTQRIGSITLVR